jgi:tetratricopeptide (TPR) repeat protein
VLAAAGLVVAGLHPLADAAARARSAVLADPVVLAASAAEVGLPTADELARVARRAADDPLAARAMALRDKRAGRLVEAREAYARLLAAAPSEGRLYNNAANVALALDHQEEAIALYEKAVARDPGPAILFNLSQAYGRAVRLDAQDLALAQAQELDPEAVAELTNLFSAYSPLAVVDLPVRVETVAPRLAAPLAAHRLAIDFRRRVAPAGATRSLEQTAALFGLAALAGVLLGLVLGRVAGDVSDDDHYADIARLLQRRGTDPGERMRRLDALRARQARVRRLQLVLAFVLPGAAGLLARRAALAWLGCVCFAGAATLWLLRDGVVPDPLAVGPLPVLVGGAALAALALVYVAALAMALSLREKA